MLQDVYFLEGRILTDALYEIDKSMIEKINEESSNICLEVLHYGKLDYDKKQRVLDKLIEFFDKFFSITGK